MRLSFLTVVAFAALLAATHEAQAFSVDKTTANSGNSSARFSDPDDQAEASFGLHEGQPINNDGTGSTFRYGPVSGSSSILQNNCTARDHCFGYYSR